MRGAVGGGGFVLLGCGVLMALAAFVMAVGKYNPDGFGASAPLWTEVEPAPWFAAGMIAALLGAVAIGWASDDD